jgi:formylglycine-generating enzyme
VGAYPGQETSALLGALQMSTQDDPDLRKRQTRDRDRADMIFIPGGTFRMGSDKHYAEETPGHPVKVDAFWIDRTPVTNRAFRKFVNATG